MNALELITATCEPGGEDWQSAALERFRTAAQQTGVHVTEYSNDPGYNASITLPGVPGYVDTSLVVEEDCEDNRGGTMAFQVTIGLRKRAVVLDAKLDARHCSAFTTSWLANFFRQLREAAAHDVKTLSVGGWRATGAPNIVRVLSGVPGSPDLLVTATSEPSRKSCVEEMIRAGLISRTPADQSADHRAWNRITSGGTGIRVVHTREPSGDVLMIRLTLFSTPFFWDVPAEGSARDVSGLISGLRGILRAYVNRDPEELERVRRWVPAGKWERVLEYVNLHGRPTYEKDRESAKNLFHLEN